MFATPVISDLVRRMATEPITSVEQHPAAVVGITVDFADATGVAAIVEQLQRTEGLSVIVLPSSRAGDRATLARLTGPRVKHPIRWATPGAVLEPDSVYLVHDEGGVVLRGRALEPLHGNGPDIFDLFLASLANDQRERAVGVVLSPRGDCGVVGLHAIDEVGGCSLGPLAWQNGGEGFDARVFPFEQVVQAIPERVKEHVESLRTSRPTASADRAWPMGRSGILVARDLLSAKRLTSSPRVHQTGSFSLRGPAWSGLRAHLETIVCTQGSHSLRAWVPECGDGQEVYTLAMLLLTQNPTRSFQIFGSNRDARQTALARSGRYPLSALDTLTAEQRERFFLLGDEYAVVKPTLRHSALFGTQDHTQDAWLSRIDLVSARHLAERRDPEEFRSWMQRFHFALRGGGWLFVGQVDNRLVPRALFELVDDSCGLFRARAAEVVRTAAYSQYHQALRSSQESGALQEELRGLSSQRQHELQRLDRALADLQGFVDATELLAFICDADLRITRCSSRVAELVKVEAIEAGLLLEDIAPRLPGGRELLALARSVQKTGRPAQELHCPPGQPATTYSVRVLPCGGHRGQADGIVIVFTDVTEFERMRQLAVRREHQQSALAALGLSALQIQGHAVTPSRDLYRRALTMLCESLEWRCGAILECGLNRSPLSVQATVGVDAALQHVVVEPGSPLDKALLANGCIELASPHAERCLVEFMGADSPSTCLACPLRVGDSVLGLLFVCAAKARQVSPEDANLVQAIANIVAGAVSRQRHERRATLERELGMILARAADASSMSRSLAMLVEATLKGRQLGVWKSHSFAQGHPLQRIFPEAPGDGPAPEPCALVEESFDSSGTIWSTETAEDGMCLRVAFPIMLGRHAVGVVDYVTCDPSTLDGEMLAGFDRAGHAIGDFLHWERLDHALKLSEKSHREQRLELESMYATLPVGVSVYDRALRPLRTNQQRTELGTSEDFEVSLAGVVLQDVFKHGKPVRNIELTAEVKGEPHSLLCSFAPITSSDGEVTAVSSVVQDVTDQKRTERALRDAGQQKDHFLAMLGHELRNPLAAMSGVTELLGLGNPEPDRLSKIHAILQRQCSQMKKLIDGLLDMSRIMQGKIELQRSSIDLGRMLHDIVEDHRVSTERKQVQVTLEGPEAAVWVDADSVRLKQVFDNLVSNACKFTPAGGTIHIEASTDGARAKVVVTDSGPGLDADLLPFIFEPFSQATQARAQGGLGLGLSLVRGFVELHGGSVSAENLPGSGARFVVELDLADEPGCPPTVPPLQGDAYRVLIIEDNMDMAETLSELLESSGHDVVGVAARGEEGLAQTKLLRPDVVLSDLGLPGNLDGFGLASCIRADPNLNSTRLVALTGYGDPTTRQRALAAGFDSCLTKPVTLEVIHKELTRNKPR